MRRPAFWDEGGIMPALLWPFSCIWTLATRHRQASNTAQRAGVPVICVGNVTAGGGGKTPTCIALAERLTSQGWQPHVLSRGYGGRLKGPVKVDPESHTARDVGDEPLLIARHGPVWIGADRLASAARAVADGADLLIMDDGLQNPSLARELVLLVIDGPAGLGNGRVIPAGPLREPLGDALAKTHAVLLVGSDPHRLGERLAASVSPILHADIRPRAGALVFQGEPVYAFAGIARPEKFFATLNDLGAVVLKTRSFPDHHVFDPMTVTTMLEEAVAMGARLVTTEKDWVRLDAATRPLVEPVPVDMVFADTGALDDVVLAHCSQPAP
ncbi:MAG: tetraacyldisaccharide 4'-kinase [Alphaproteobacteria bacterium]|jgi:tetraacyldisaccharide 4'-kinase|nr:tetraacyldisaccharide 4'-kinase [Rhodospirillaceae bacterium]MBT6510268.1 tetraacyldisaccharide 4'-kinase [Rhodospirillaceae bacterium]MBT7613613.1 tetraacyldisaccharide 4'-kinase [Rhodospirillaceae bacterium]MBT7645498.1 tetraacyldisaccharide 4'-kinase [Rhodospirillaceae bacterium]MDG2482137.1 tetraacyldisaccharide 4'-kinase [Alphaproteobacteria bacterium]